MRKLERAARALGSSPTSNELHRVRILAKRSRYGCEASIDVFGEPMRVVSRRLRELQDALGELQDDAVLVSYLRDLAARDPALAFSAGEAAGLVAAQRKANPIDWRRAWRRVEPRLRRWR
jgi:CHAD domain-containing protein